jgi:type I restriction enzyme S subunit
MSEWRETTLGKCADIQTGPFGSQLHASDYVEVGIPSIMPTNIGNSLKINRLDIAKISKEDATRLDRYLVNDCDIVYSRRGDVEKCAYITSAEKGWLCGTGCLRVRITSDNVNPKFCAYYLSAEDSKGWIRGNAVGTTMPNLNTGILSRVPLLLPPLSVQCAIAEILSSLDDKIDLLTRQNATLEALAQTYFRQWFVEEASENWEEKSLYEIVDILGGGTPSTKVTEYWDGDIPWFTPKDATNLICMSTEKQITQDGLNHCNSKLYPVGTVFISARGTVGKLAICGVPMAMNQTCYALVGKGKISNFIAYLAISHSITELQLNASGAIFDAITTDTFKAIKLNLPSINDQLFIDTSKDLLIYYDKIIANTHQIHTLQNLRDTLLPKLISGEVRVIQDGGGNE